MVREREARGPPAPVIRSLGLRDTWWALVLADTSFALPLVLWLVAGFIRELPRELEEAAFVDGASRLGALWHVLPPAAAPGVAAAAVLASVPPVLVVFLLQRHLVRGLLGGAEKE